MLNGDWEVHIPRDDGSLRKMNFVVGRREQHGFKEGELVPMLVHLKTLDHHWSKDKSFYIPPGGEDIKGRRAGVEQHFSRGTEVDMPRVYLDNRGVLGVGDGRHRLAVLRDRGVSHAPVIVPREAAVHLWRTFHRTYEQNFRPGR